MLFLRFVSRPWSEIIMPILLWYNLSEALDFGLLRSGEYFMKTKKWISELQLGELFTIMANVTDVSHYFVALGDIDSISKYGSRPCRVFVGFKSCSYYFFANVQVYSCGLIVTKLQ